jgi:hypothetical protein
LLDRQVSGLPPDTRHLTWENAQVDIRLLVLTYNFPSLHAKIDPFAEKIYLGFRKLGQFSILFALAVRRAKLTSGIARA